VPLEAHETPRFVGTAESKPPRTHRRLELTVVLAAIIGRLPSLGAWWNLDDWGLLGRAAGLVSSEAPLGFPARWLSQHLYWDLAYPLFGLAADPYTWSRILLHAGCAWLVVRIAARVGLPPVSRLVAGLMMAATPLAFTPLYWAAGIQELLAAFFALLAVERWLAAGHSDHSRANLAWAVALAALSMLAKESGLGLPILFLAFLWTRVGVKIEDKAFGWAMTLLLLLAAVVEGVLVTSHFATGPGDPYAMGNAKDVATNLGVFGWWMLSPGPILASNIHWPMTAAGAMLFVGWGVWSFSQAQLGRSLPGLTLLAALLVIGPALGLHAQTHPYLAYLAIAPMALAVGCLLPGHWKASWKVLIAATVVAAAWSFWSMDLRLGQRDGMGLPSDPVVKATSLSWRFCRQLPDLPLDRGQESEPALTLLQIPPGNEAVDLADKLGDRWVAGTHLHEAIGGSVGPRLVLESHHGKDVRVDWVNALFTNPRQALVLCSDGPDFKHWGTTDNAAYFAALTDVGLRRFDRARKHLIRASTLQATGDPANRKSSFFFDPDQMVVSMGQVLEHKEYFMDWTVGLLEQGHSPQEVGGLQDVFLQLLVAGTGQSLEELTVGSNLLNLQTPNPTASEQTGE